MLYMKVYEHSYNSSNQDQVSIFSFFIIERTVNDALVSRPFFQLNLSHIYLQAVSTGSNLVLKHFQMLNLCSMVLPNVCPVFNLWFNDIEFVHHDYLTTGVGNNCGIDPCT